MWLSKASIASSGLEYERKLHTAMSPKRPRICGVLMLVVFIWRSDKGEGKLVRIITSGCFRNIWHNARDAAGEPVANNGRFSCLQYYLGTVSTY